ncbi:VTC4 [Symbiodinium microadriaticum]|nr:VTC4 [Symbiodinium microadriaticum]
MDALGSYERGQDFLARANVPDKLAKDLADPYCDPSVRLCVTRLLGFIAGRSAASAKLLLSSHEAPFPQSIAGMLDSRDVSERLCAINAWATASLQSEGLSFFLRWTPLLQEMVSLVSATQNEVAKAAMDAWATILQDRPPVTDSIDEAAVAIAMGFTKKVAQEPTDWQQFYVNYEELKQAVINMAEEEEEDPSSGRGRIMTADMLDDTTKMGRFQGMLRAELNKVNDFACVKHEDIFLGLRKVCAQCKKLQPEEIENKAANIRELGQQIVHLDSFVRLNYVGFQTLTEKFDDLLGTAGSALFVSGLHCEPFCNIRFDDILILLGLAWALWRTAQSTEQSKDATWKPPESFIRNTSKYWVAPENVVLLKTRIVEHLPYLIFGASQTEQETLLEPFALLDLEYDGLDDQKALSAYSGTMEESQLLSSVYFDSPEATSYQERIRREEGARLVRFRWYGENSQEPDKEIYVERKIHHEGWGGKKSAKERCVIPQEDIFDFMKGKFDIDGYFKQLEEQGMYSEKARKNMKGIAVEVNKLIQDKKLQPIIRTSYYRCAFQLATDNKVRISLDTQMSLLNEYMAGGHQNKPWCHIASDSLQRDDVYRFPYAILEIKLQDVSEAPLWLRQTLNDISAIQVHKFSKFQHAMAFLHPQRVPILPHWHKDFQEWQNKKDDAEANFRRRKKLSSKERIQMIQGSSFTELDLQVPAVEKVVAPHGEGHFLKDMENLDPKAVFANERTLLHYAEKGMYVAAVAVVAMNHNSRDIKIFGLVLSALTAAYYLWILVAYFQRLSEITGRSKVVKNREARLDWEAGPWLAAGMVLVVLVYTLSKAQEGPREIWTIAEQQVTPSVLKNLSVKPFPDARPHTWRVLSVLVRSRSAAQQALDSQEVQELLLNFQSETSTDARYAKHDLVKTLLQWHSNWLSGLLDSQVFELMSQFAEQGPYWVPRAAGTAMRDEAA